MTSDYIFQYDDAQGISYPRLKFVQGGGQPHLFGIFQPYGTSNLVELELARVMLNEEGQRLAKIPGEIYPLVQGGLVDMWGDVVRFHQKYGIDYDGPPRTLDAELEKFRRDFMTEEFREFSLAKTDEDRLDACMDLIYVVLGYGRLRGWNIPEAWRRVQRANMAKRLATEQDPKRHGMDVVKPPGWVPPDHSDLVKIGGRR